MVWRVSATVGLALLAQGGVAAATTTITCCEDATGRRVCGDVLPPACYGRAYWEVTPQGTVIKQVPAPMTPAERARMEEAEKARKLLETKAREQRQRDSALLQTYASLEELEKHWQRAVTNLERELEEASRRETEVLQRRGKLDQEARAYVKAPMPPELAIALRENDSELAAQRSVIASKQRDLEAVKARYDSDRRRYVELQAEKASRP